MKIPVYKEIKQEMGTCNWCTQTKTCWVSETFEVWTGIHVTNTKELRWLREGVLGGEKLFWVLPEPLKYEDSKTKAHAKICTDCIKSLAKE